MSMTENEKVKEWFKTELSMSQEESLDAIECEDMMNICVKALEEIQQYRAIGTVEQLNTLQQDYWKLNEVCKEYSAIGTIDEFKALKEKMASKKVVAISLTHEGRVGNCPNCNNFVAENYDKNCPKCSRELDWS